MKAQPTQVKPDAGHPVEYEIVVKGHIDASCADWFEGMSMIPGVGTNGAAVTTLSGGLADQAALFGLLRKLYDLHLVLLSINRKG
jgi:hypothetical protein